jgi:hypothetical protein
MGRVSMRKTFVFILLSAMFSIILVQGVSAQEKSGDVCLVYFTSHACGDDCWLTDTFMDGLLSEYAGNLISITYYVDSSQENQNVFQTYRSAYGLPQDVPMVLFGKDDYLQGIDGIYSNTELKILGFLDINGTNCPLDSGYVHPSQLSAGNLPGQPQINIIIGANNTKTTGKDGSGTGIVPTENGSGENDSAAAGQNPLIWIFTVDEPARESLLSLIIIIVVLILVGIMVFVILGKSQESL